MRGKKRGRKGKKKKEKKERTKLPAFPSFQSKHRCGRVRYNLEGGEKRDKNKGRRKKRKK